MVGGERVSRWSTMSLRADVRLGPAAAKSAGATSASARADCGPFGSSADLAARPDEPTPLLRVPPFPGSKPVEFEVGTRFSAKQGDDADIGELVEAIRSARVGGTYWGRRPDDLPPGYILVRVRDVAARAKAVTRLPGPEPVVVWTDTHDAECSLPVAGHVTGPCDPWHLLEGASGAVIDANDEVAVLARIAGVPMQCVGRGRFSAFADASGTSMHDAFRDHVLLANRYFDPFSGEPISMADAIRYCGFWRDLIDRNRALRGGVGFAFWKKATVAPLLWRGSELPFFSGSAGIESGDRIAIWKSRVTAATVAELEQKNVQLVEVEDGFIRSAGLGADCVPPLSIVVDQLGVHFDPSRPSELEHLLQDSEFPASLIDRARRLRELIVTSGLTKYAAGVQTSKRRDPDRRHVLVPGQVEDDRAVICGGGGLTSNLELLQRVRRGSPDAYILYKPHPDVEAGHRAGFVGEKQCLEIADEIVTDEPMSALLGVVDEVQVNSSLAGFEALLRGTPVTTHGVPFYAGWGLTRDLGSVPARRTAKRTIDELTAAVLLLYPRYLDPITRLPCPAEILVRRLAQSVDQPSRGVLVKLRQLQGRCRRRLATLARQG